MNKNLTRKQLIYHLPRSSESISRTQDFLSIEIRCGDVYNTILMYIIEC